MKCAALLFVVALPMATAHAADYAVQQSGSTLGFAGSFQGAPFEGRFTRWTATIAYDPAALANGHFDVTIDVGSAVTGDKDRDGALPGTDFFDAAKFPKAHYVSTGFRRSGAQVTADGTLTLHGVTRPLQLAVTFTPAGKGATLDVAGTLKRLDYGVGGGEYADTSVIGADVKVHAHLVLSAK